MTKSLEMMNILREWDHLERDWGHLKTVPVYGSPGSQCKYPALDMVVWHLKALSHPVTIVDPLAKLLAISTDENPRMIQCQLALILHTHVKNNPDMVLLPRYRITRDDYELTFGSETPIWIDGRVTGPIIQEMLADVVGTSERDWADRRGIVLLNTESFWRRLFWGKYDPNDTVVPEMSQMSINLSYQNKFLEDSGL